jgi:hypothetical protein
MNNNIEQQQQQLKDVWEIAYKLAKRLKMIGGHEDLLNQYNTTLNKYLGPENNHG